MIPVTNQIIRSPKDKINAKKMLKSPNLSILDWQGERLFATLFPMVQNLKMSVSDGV